MVTLSPKQKWTKYVFNMPKEGNRKNLILNIKCKVLSCRYLDAAETWIK